MNNFARRATDFVNKLFSPPKGCGHAALDDEQFALLAGRVSPELRSSAVLGLKTNTQMLTAGCFDYKALAESKPA